MSDLSEAAKTLGRIVTVKKAKACRRNAKKASNDRFAKRMDKAGKK